MEKMIIRTVKVSEFTDSGVEFNVCFGFTFETEIGNVIATPFDSFEEVKEALSLPNIKRTFIDHVNPIFLSNLGYYYETDNSDGPVMVELLGKQYTFDVLFPFDE